MNENKPRRRAQAQAAQKATRKSGLSRFVLMVTMMALVAVVSIGGTMAWLQDNTEEVVNTFTGSNIDIEIAEKGAETVDGKLTKEFKMVPGAIIDKDPKVTVKANSEASYVFVKLTKTDATYPDTVNADVPKTFDDYLTYTVDSSWTELGTAYPGVYYRTQDATTADTDPMSVLTGDKVYVKDSVTKEMMDALQTEGSTYPKLTVQAFAVQQLGMNNDPVAAWLTLPGNETSGSTDSTNP